MAAKALLAENSNPTYEEVAVWLMGNICCGGCYPSNVESTLEVAKEGHING